MVNAKRDSNNHPSMTAMDGNTIRNILVDDDGKIILTSATKNTTYTNTDQNAVRDDNSTPSLIGVTPLGKIRRLQTDSDGKLKFVQK